MKRFIHVVLLAALLLLPATGYSADEVTPQPAQTPAGHPTVPAAQPAPAEPAKEPVKENEGKPATISGKVVETMNSGGYTYVSLENNGKRTWVAAPLMTVAVGQELTFSQGGLMANFASRSLKRTFDEIYFCGAPISQSGAGVPPSEKKSPGSVGAKVEPEEKIKVDKAVGANAYTVGDIYKKKGQLNNKQVVVKGKVVKVSTGIMGKNWIHLQDGSGNKKKATNNLVVTSNDLAAVGDVITITGTMIKDKDFGSGYRYDVIVEEASIKK